MDFDKLKEGIREISQIAQEVPEAFRERCFDALLTALLAEATASVKPVNAPPQPPASDVTPQTKAEEPPALPEGTAPPIKGQVRVFLQRTKLGEDVLARVVSYVDDEVHFLQEPKPSKLSQGQIEWTLLSALKNAIESNTFTVDANAVRDLCDEKGFLDANNYWAIFGRNERLFSKPLTREDPKQTLSSEGQTELADLVKSLASR